MYPGIFYFLVSNKFQNTKNRTNRRGDDYEQTCGNRMFCLFADHTRVGFSTGACDAYLGGYFTSPMGCLVVCFGYSFYSLGTPDSPNSEQGRTTFEGYGRIGRRSGVRDLLYADPCAYRRNMLPPLRHGPSRNLYRAYIDGFGGEYCSCAPSAVSCPRGTYHLGSQYFVNGSNGGLHRLRDICPCPAVGRSVGSSRFPSRNAIGLGGIRRNVFLLPRPCTAPVLLERCFWPYFWLLSPPSSLWGFWKDSFPLDVIRSFMRGVRNFSACSTEEGAL